VCDRDVIHFCKLVAAAEHGHVGDVMESKEELTQKFRAFIKVCDEHLDDAV
jgi:hypothetical protein